MGDILELLTDKHIEWAMAQKIFFVSTAPLSQDGRVNCSPKGGGCFRFLDNQTFVYSDYTGSGNETISHVNENGRILIMFCAFEGAPRIMRLHGQGEAILPGHSEFDDLRQLWPEHPGLRSFIKISIERASVSCGFSVPFFDFVKHRDALGKWAAGKGPEGVAEYRREKNQTSIDGLPGYAELLENNIEGRSENF
jgi:hypothetical protein